MTSPGTCRGRPPALRSDTGVCAIVSFTGGLSGGGGRAGTSLCAAHRALKREMTELPPTQGRLSRREGVWQAPFADAPVGSAGSRRAAHSLYFRVLTQVFMSCFFSCFHNPG